jgi:hypothetical protein
LLSRTQAAASPAAACWRVGGAAELAQRRKKALDFVPIGIDKRQVLPIIDLPDPGNRALCEVGREPSASM